MTMENSENANTIIRNRIQLAPLIGKRISFIGYLCSFSKNKYGDTDNYPYVALLIDVFNSKYKLNLEHLHVQLTESDYQMLKNRIDLFVAFTGTIFTYEAHVRSTYKNKHQKTEYRILREPRYGVEDVSVENVNMSDKLDQFNIEFNSILTIYESYALRQVITNLKKIGIRIVSKNIIITRLIEEKSVLKRDKMLRNLQTELTYGTLTKESVPEIFYNKPALLNEDDFAAIIEENRRKQHSLKVDRELRILQSLYHDLEKQLKKEQQCNQQLEQNLKQANVNTGKVINNYKKTINQYKSVLVNHDLKLWQFLKIYVEYRFIQVKNLFKQDKNKKRFRQKIKEHDSISTEDLQRLKDKFEN